MTKRKLFFHVLLIILNTIIAVLQLMAGNISEAILCAVAICALFIAIIVTCPNK